MLCSTNVKIPNVVLYATHGTQRRCEQEYPPNVTNVLIGVISAVIFTLAFYGLWFDKPILLLFTGILLSLMLLLTLSAMFIPKKILHQWLHHEHIPSNSSIEMNDHITCSNHSDPSPVIRKLFSSFFSFNYLLSSRLIRLLISALLNLIGIWLVFYLFVCVTDNYSHTPYRSNSCRYYV
ncbi:unnamed protein product [Didymodactylos carnosus]|uniref:Uncharacterized protein n=1 Tax=Didymodactylos carnosus TaxID=1234261 RepID=A0A815WW20_9BILA|nr:unnamed protein product [Didymodactylos carnosus]CAF1549634.1 unnamed protein product [Didymodactylos carnosus]CAF4199157.1 unnamed protein product [Didymodactylos carnosus]CAF4410576.1 unnamed protein product [Didymodactylos carnosus]